MASMGRPILDLIWSVLTKEKKPKTRKIDVEEKYADQK